MKGKALLEFHEGRKLEPYKDSLGYWTIGVGHLIDARLGAKPPPAIPLSLAQCDALFDQDIAKHQALIDKQAPWVNQLSEVRRYILLDMTFNLGIEPFDDDGFKDWPIFCRQVQQGLFNDAARNMRSTTWAAQVKARAERLAKMMELDKWPNEPGVPRIDA